MTILIGVLTDEYIDWLRGTLIKDADRELIVRWLAKCVLIT
jgi:hypothetical protein